MKKLRRCFELFAVVAALAVIAATPGTALGASEEPAGGSTAGETSAESPGASTESAAPGTSEEAPSTATAPPSAGWAPQGEGKEASSQSAASTRRGSSLGVGAASKQADSKSEEPAPAQGSDSNGYEETESSSPGVPAAPSTSEATAKEPRVASPVEPVEQPAAKATPAKEGHAALGSAIQVGLPRSTLVADTSSRPTTAPLAATRVRATPDSGGLPLPILIVCVLALLLAGGRLLLGPVEPDIFRSGPLERVRRSLTRV